MDKKTTMCVMTAVSALSVSIWMIYTFGSVEGNLPHRHLTNAYQPGDSPGQAFNISPQMLQSVGMPMTDFITLSMSNANDFVFVTCASANHFGESKNAVHLVQKYFPSKTIYYYDLGLLSGQVKEVKQWCNVEYKLFNTSRYPAHVSNLQIYAFKPLLIYEMLQTHSGVLYMDSSVRFKTGNLQGTYKMATQNGGIVHFSFTGHSIFAATDPRMYKYLGTNGGKLKSTQMTECNVMLLYKTQVAYESFLHWWVMCALEAECISPSGTTKNFSFTKDSWNDSGKCHRYDQSAASILLVNMHRFNLSEYVPMNNKAILIVNRHTDPSYAPVPCA